MTDGRIAPVRWKPHYPGFKQLNVPAPIPADLPEHREVVDEERRRYLPDT